MKNLITLENTKFIYLIAGIVLSLFDEKFRMLYTPTLLWCILVLTFYSDIVFNQKLKNAKELLLLVAKAP